MDIIKLESGAVCMKAGPHETCTIGTSFHFLVLYVVPASFRCVQFEHANDRYHLVFCNAFGVVRLHHPTK